MRSIRLQYSASALAITVSLALGAPAFAAEKPAADSSDATTLDTVVVTASSGEKSRIKSSISVSQVSQETIAAFTPRSEAEVLRLVPGVLAQDTAGPGGNSNIGVRGLPVVTGGSEFVALQEDGLPVTLFGDIQFGNNDYWLRFDQNVERVEAVRGGSASTFTSQAPGAVINYISKTGKVEGGSIGLSKGVNFNETKIDFDYGGHLSDTLRFHLGGFVKEGNGPTDISYLASKGYQLKGNITKDFEDGSGYVRVNFKRLDSQEPTYTTAPSLATLSGNEITGFSALPGFDARNGSNQSRYNQSFQYVTTGGQLASAKMEGIHPKVTSIGGEFEKHLTENLTFHDNLRHTEMSGAFATQFVNVATRASVIGSTVNGSVVGSIKYANGPKQGQAFTGTYLNNNPNINTIMRDMGSLANDMTLTGKFDVAEGRLTAKAGWFHMRQTISQEWHVNPQYNELIGNDPAQLDLFSTTGAQLTAAGQAGFNNNWGNCCARTMDLTYTDDAAYLSLDYVMGALDLDASVRRDSVKSEGEAQAGVAGPNFTVSDALGTVTLPSMLPGGAKEVLDYTKSYTSWSVGALYSINDNLSVFGRASRGGRFNADRRTLGGNFNKDGSLNAQGQATAVNFVEQQEIGVKNRGAFAGVDYNFEGTWFRASLTDNNYDFTRLSNPAPNNNPITSNVYKSYGLELSGSAHYQNFHLLADGTYVNSEISESTSAPATKGKTPHASPEFYFQVSPSYDNGTISVGLSINGQTSSYIDDTNAFKVKGQTYVNGFFKARPWQGVEVGVNVNNLFDTLGYRGNGSLLQLSPTQGIFQNSAVLGRTVTASVFYRF